MVLFLRTKFYVLFRINQMARWRLKSPASPFVCSSVGSDPDQRKHQSSASLALVRGIHRWLVNSLHKRPVTRHFFPFDDVIHIIHINKYFTASTLTTFQVLLAGFALGSARFIYYYQISRKTSSMRRTKSQTLECFAYRLAAAFAQSNEARCSVSVGIIRRTLVEYTRGWVGSCAADT